MEKQESIESTTKNAKHKSKKRKIFANFLFCFVIFVLVALVVFVNIFQLCLVVGSSMEKTLSDGDYLLLKRRGYEVSRGDIVTVYVQKEEKTTIIKRVIAKKGDRLVFMEEGENEVSVYLDKGKGFEKLIEPYLLENMNEQNCESYDKFLYGDYKISPNCQPSDIEEQYIIDVDGLFVMGDNRNSSLDSRHYGVIPYKNVRGEVVSKLKKGSITLKILKILF